MYEISNFNQAILTNGSYCSVNIQSASEEEKKRIFNCVNGDCQGLRDYVNKEILLANVFAESGNQVDEETGEVKETVRIILIDSEGVGYATSSIGVRGSLSKLFQLFGTPDTWSAPIKVIPKQINRKDKVILTLSLG